MWAGLIAITNQGRVLESLGSLNGRSQTLPSLYSLSSSAFHDITTGNNGFAAGSGYDLVTGIGSPVSNALVPWLAGYSVSHLAFGQQPTSIVAGGTISPAVTVDVESGNGSIITTDNSNVTLSIYSGPSGGTLQGNVTMAAVNGLATFNNLSLTTTGSYVLDASDGSYAAASSSAFSVTAAAAAKLAFVQQPSNGTVARAISPAVTVQVQDRFGNAETGDASTVTMAMATAPEAYLAAR